MNLDKFKELLSVPSKTYQEEDMVEYLCNELDTFPGVSYYRDEMMNLSPRLALTAHVKPALVTHHSTLTG